jgi:hypothetical protein
MNSEGDQRMDACRPVVAAWNISGHDAPVFVDDSGRRAHGVHLAGVTIAIVCASWLAMLVFGLSGLRSLPGTPASAPLVSTQGQIVDIEPVLGKLRWADDTIGPSAGRRLDLSYGGGAPE